MRKIYWIGIDIASKTLAVSVIKTAGEPELLNLTVSNSGAGIKTLFTTLRKHQINPKDCWFCFEHTGNYGLLLAISLQEKKYTYSLVPAMEIKSSQGVQRGKTDATDAKQIATYALVHNHKLKPSQLPGRNLLLIKELLSYRNLLVKTRTKFKNSIQSRQLLSRLIDNKWILTDLSRRVQELNEQIKRTEITIEDTIAHSELSNNYDLVKSVKGIGLVTAAALVSLTNNFTSFDSSREFNSYAGIAPFKHESGTSIRGKTKVSNYANKWIKTILYNAANSAVMYDPELKSYFKRKRAQNKNHTSIINAVASKVVARAFAVVHRQTPFVSTYAQKI
jgi:transposase